MVPYAMPSRPIRPQRIPARSNRRGEAEATSHRHPQGGRGRGVVRGNATSSQAVMLTQDQLKEALEQLPVHCHRELHGGSEEESTCCICLDVFAEGDILRLLPCFHRFHTPCIDGWLHQQLSGGRGVPLCPLCKENPFAVSNHPMVEDI